MRRPIGNSDTSDVSQGSVPEGLDHIGGMLHIEEAPTADDAAGQRGNAAKARGFGAGIGGGGVQRAVRKKKGRK